MLFLSNAVLYLSTKFLTFSRMLADFKPKEVPAVANFAQIIKDFLQIALIICPI